MLQMSISGNVTPFNFTHNRKIEDLLGSYETAKAAQFGRLLN